jgi:superfamily II DNA/RNA helicase
VCPLSGGIPAQDSSGYPGRFPRAVECLADEVRRTTRREASTLSRSSSTTSISPSQSADQDTAEPVAVEHHETGAPADTSHPLRGDAPVKAKSPTFAELGVREEIVRALRSAGIEHTFAIQELTLPLALAGHDLIGQARTGMGKTLGFGVPLLQRITTPGDGTPQVLVVVPTRELCVQVAHDLTDAGKHLGIRTLAIYGGRPYETQIEALRKGVDLVIGTPGRLLDLAEQRHLVLGKVKGLVLDEADEMLDLGFLPDIERILHMLPDQRQTMLFSATMPGPIITLARTFLDQPTHVRAEENDAGAVHERTTQFVYRAHSMDKADLIAKSLQAKDRGLTMIFTRTKRTAQKVADDLGQRGFAVAAVHGDLAQGAREQALRAFRAGKIDVLVATDVAARGIDVDDVTHVINHQTPEDEKTYVHRIGRTGRAGKTGVAITLVDWDELPRWKSISDALGLDKPLPVETYSTSKHLFEDLDIPQDAGTRLPLSQRTRAGLAAEPEENMGGRKRARPGSNAPKTRGPRRRTRKGVDAATGEPAKSDEVASSPAPAGASSKESAGEPRRRKRTRANTTSSNKTTSSSVAEIGPKTGTETGLEIPSAPASKAAFVEQNGEKSEKPVRRRRRRREGNDSE